MAEVMTVSKMLQGIADDMCDNYCKWPEKVKQEGKDEDWLCEDPESPCQKCPLNRLS